MHETIQAVAYTAAGQPIIQWDLPAKVKGAKAYRTPQNYTNILYAGQMLQIPRGGWLEIAREVPYES